MTKSLDYSYNSESLIKFTNMSIIMWQRLSSLTFSLSLMDLIPLEGG